MDGIILVKKPKGMTSFTCVSQVKRRVNERKAGHSGTLDPNAEGFMIIALGKCTKYLPYCVSNHKHYQATFALGKRYDTQDVWGEAVEEKTPSMHTCTLTLAKPKNLQKRLNSRFFSVKLLK